MTSAEKINLLNLSHNELIEFFATLGEKPYRAQQFLKWVHQQGEIDFSAMSTFSKKLRTELQQVATISLPEVVYNQSSQDGTEKWLLKLSCGNCVETVFIPEGERGTLCVSSQIGCGLNCSFCSTATQGFNRNLSTGEIISQLWVAVRRLSTVGGIHDKKVTNVVFMGMGEPLLNFDNVTKALELMMDDFAYGLSKRRVTLSSSGLVPELKRLSEISGASLAISLHASTNELRDVLVPINKKYPLEELLPVCRDYFKQEPRRKVTFEYVMLENVNDSDEQAYQLAKILQGIPAKVNLIPFNPFPGTQYKRSSQARINCFRDILSRKGINTITRKTRGDDIDAACGQLVGKFQDRTSRSARWGKIHLAARQTPPVEHNDEAI